MSKQEYPYPDDEFDALGERRVPQGVHREPTPRWRQWLPYLLVLILVPLLTLAAVKYFSSPSDPTPEASPTESAPAETEEPDVEEPEDDAEGETDGEDEETDPDADAEDEDTDSEEEPTEEPEEPELDFSKHVLILNGAGVQGLAGEVAEALAADGWENTEADNYQSATPEASTVYYTSEEFEDEAQEVAQRLGIDQLVEDAGSASNGIVVVIRTDFSLPPAN